MESTLGLTLFTALSLLLRKAEKPFSFKCVHGYVLTKHMRPGRWNLLHGRDLRREKYSGRNIWNTSASFTETAFLF
jgi:hypothetical protein